ncbi:MAG: copper(I)-binding protein CorA [Gammaproteobacteria bacterium]
MLYNNKLNVRALVLATVGLMSVPSVHGATSIETKNVEFTQENSVQTLAAKPESWYNPTMGYTGWTHHSSWGYMKLKKGKPVTITATGVAGFHPALTIWFRPQKRGMVPVNYMNDHFYNQFQDIIASNVQLTDDPANPKKLGKLRMEFVANAFDRDGMIDPLPAEFDQSMLNRVLDGIPGTVSLTFTPKASGVYQFVVGGINPDLGLDLKASHEVEVTVGFSE